MQSPLSMLLRCLGDSKMVITASGYRTHGFQGLPNLPETATGSFKDGDSKGVSIKVLSKHQVPRFRLKIKTTTSPADRFSESIVLICNALPHYMHFLVRIDG